MNATTPLGGGWVGNALQSQPQPCSSPPSTEQLRRVKPLMGNKKAATNPRKVLVRDEFLTKAAEVFDRKGFAQTRIQDIAEALSLSRSALYHYFTSKEEILAALVEEHTKIRAEVLATLTGDAARPATDRLRDALRSTIAERLSDGARLRVLDHLVLEMPPEIRKAFDRARRRILDLYTGIIQDGVNNREFRPIDPRTAALAVLGIASWTSWWYSPAGRKTPAELTDILVDIALNGVTARTPVAAPADQIRLIGEIRSRLDALENL